MTSKPEVRKLHRLFEYDPVSGFLTRREQHRYDLLAGDEVGTKLASGYRQVSIEGHTYMTHVVIWAMHYGEWPTFQIDHKDRVRDHNWIDNLRPASGSQQRMNSSLRKDNTSGTRGVYLKRNKWAAEIRINKRKIFLGVYPTYEDAKEFRDLCESMIFGEFSTV